MKIKYNKITKFNVVFNLKKMEKSRVRAERREKYFGMEFNVFYCDNKKCGKRISGNKLKLSFRVTLLFHRTLWVNKFEPSGRSWVAVFGTGRDLERRSFFEELLSA